MKLHLLLVYVVLLGSSRISKVEAARILALFQLHVKSHFIMFEALLKELAAKGYDVVTVSHFPQKNPITNYTDISIEGSLPQLLNSFTLNYAINQRWVNLLYFIWNLNVKFCEKVLDHPKVQRLIKSDEKFDLVITESFGVDCFTGFVHKLKVPHITMTSSVPMPWSDDDFGNPSNPAYIPIFFLPHTDRMNFQQRLLNTIVAIGLKLGKYYFAEIPMQKLALKHFGHDLPPLREIARNTSLIFTNSHFSLNIPRPMVPGVIEVGGLHLGDPKQLPKVNFISYILDFSVRRCIQEFPD
jgi:glucuronosyltransferase